MSVSLQSILDVVALHPYVSDTEVIWFDPIHDGDRSYWGIYLPNGRVVGHRWEYKTDDSTTDEPIEDNWEWDELEPAAQDDLYESVIEFLNEQMFYPNED